MPLLFSLNCGIFYAKKSPPIQLDPRNVISYQLPQKLELFDYIRPELSVTPDNKYIAALFRGAKGNQVAVWNLKSGQKVGDFAVKVRGGFYAIKMIDSRHLLMQRYSGQTMRFNFRTGKEISIKSKESVFNSLFVKFGSIDLASGEIVVAIKKKVYTAKLSTGEILQSFQDDRIDCEIGAPYLGADRKNIFFSCLGLENDNSGYLGVFSRPEEKLILLQKVYPTFIERVAEIRNENIIITYLKQDARTEDGELLLRSRDSLRIFSTADPEDHNELNLSRYTALLKQSGIQRLNRVLVGPGFRTAILVGQNNRYLLVDTDNFSPGWKIGNGKSINLAELSVSNDGSLLFDIEFKGEKEPVKLIIYRKDELFASVREVQQK